MTKLVWDDVGKRKFEVGVDRGVFYLPSDIGVPWNGLISVEEVVSGGESQPLYFDGIKYLDLVLAEDFKAIVSAYTYPNKFQQCDGTFIVDNGLFAHLQPRKPFNLCYRTLMGNDVESTDYGYKLHLIYNAMASPSSRPNRTMTIDPDAINFQWEINAVPVSSSTFKPTAHFTLDSTRIVSATLAGLEAILYGSDTVDPIFPTLPDLIDIVANGYITEPISEPT